MRTRDETRESTDNLNQLGAPRRLLVSPVATPGVKSAMDHEDDDDTTYEETDVSEQEESDAASLVVSRATNEAEKTLETNACRRDVASLLGELRDDLLIVEACWSPMHVRLTLSDNASAYVTLITKKLKQQQQASVRYTVVMHQEVVNLATADLESGNLSLFASYLPAKRTYVRVMCMHEEPPSRLRKCALLALIFYLLVLFIALETIYEIITQ
jgi:hypothetical protein